MAACRIVDHAKKTPRRCVECDQVLRTAAPISELYDNELVAFSIRVVVGEAMPRQSNTLLWFHQ